MNKQNHIISKGLSKIIEAHELIAHKGLDDAFCKEMAKNIEQGIRQIKEGLELDE